MKIIDLLNKIANGEEVPKKIKWDGVTFWLKGNDYFNDIDFSLFRHDDEYDILDMLNDELEILEEEKKIEFEKINEIICELNTSIKNEEGLRYFVNGIADDINKLIRNQTKIIDYLKSKGE